MSALADVAGRSITPGVLTRHIGVIADDSMLGRHTPSPGLEKTARYIVAQLQRFGLKPVGDSGGWLQRYPIPRDASTSASGPTPTAPNVIGMLEGSDPALKHEYIVISAHMDHLGIMGNLSAGARGPLDSIYNGADDNASGTAGVLALAEAFSRPGARPRRSLLFLAVSGHEARAGSRTGMFGKPIPGAPAPHEDWGRSRGWGSEYFAEHPPVPLRQIVADLNLEMIGRNWRDKIAVLGMAHSDLGATLERVVAAHPELQMRPLDEAWLQWLGRRLPSFQALTSTTLTTDHHSLARRGVPGLVFWNSIHVDTHQLTDDLEAIDAEKASRVVRLVFYLAQAIGNAPARPAWNKASHDAIVEHP